MELHRLDCLASHGSLDAYQFVQRFLVETPPEKVYPPKLVTGDDLKGMGPAPWPRFKEILLAVEEAQLEGRLSDRESASGICEVDRPRVIGRGRHSWLACFAWIAACATKPGDGGARISRRTAKSGYPSTTHDALYSADRKYGLLRGNCVSRGVFLLRLLFLMPYLPLHWSFGNF